MSKDKFEGTIVGTVERVRQYAKGDVVTIAYLTNPNNKYPSRATVWCEGSAPVAEGQRPSVTGALSVGVEEYNGKTREKVSVNFPKWSGEGVSGHVAHAAPAGPVVDAFDDGGTPF